MSQAAWQFLSSKNDSAQWTKAKNSDLLQRQSDESIHLKI
jgi:hypothetical protein